MQPGGRRRIPVRRRRRLPTCGDPRHDRQAHLALRLPGHRRVPAGRRAEHASVDPQHRPDLRPGPGQRGGARMPHAVDDQAGGRDRGQAARRLHRDPAGQAEEPRGPHAALGRMPADRRHASAREAGEADAYGARRSGPARHVRPASDRLHAPPRVRTTTVHCLARRRPDQGPVPARFLHHPEQLRGDPRLRPGALSRLERGRRGAGDPARRAEPDAQGQGRAVHTGRGAEDDPPGELPDRPDVRRALRPESLP